MNVIKFGAVWCNGCLVMKPRWAEIEKEFPWLKTRYVDFDIDTTLVKKYNIDSGILPVFVFQNTKGKEILRLSGEIEKKDLVNTIIKLKNE